MQHQNYHSKSRPKILKFDNLRKGADTVELLQVSNNLSLVVVVSLDEDPRIRLIQLHFSSQNVHQPLIGHLDLKSKFKT